MIVTNSKRNIPKLIRSLQQRLREYDKKMNQEWIANHLYPPTGSDNPKERYIKRFIRRAASTRYDTHEIVRLIRIFQPVIKPIEAILLVVWSQVEAIKGAAGLIDPIQQIREQFPADQFDEALNIYVQRTNFDDLLLATVQTRATPQKNYIPLYRLSTAADEVDPARLVGIEPVVQKIVRLLNTESGSRFFSIEGQGGMGKTSIAYAVTEQIRKGSTFKAVIWISVGSFLSIGSFQIQEMRYDSIFRQVSAIFNLNEASVLNLLDTEPYLVVIDNIETRNEAEGGLLDGLPSLKQGASRFLITSRYAMNSLYSYIHSIELKELSNQSVQKLLENLFEGREKITAQKAMRVKKVVGGIPLAIHLLARLARTANLNSVLDVVEKLQIDITDKLEKLSIVFDYIYGVIWQDHLQSGTKEVLVRLAVQIPVDGFAVEWLENATGIHNPALTAALENAMDYYLITKAESEEGDLLFMHPLTRSYIKLAQKKGRSNAS